MEYLWPRQDLEFQGTSILHPILKLVSFTEGIVSRTDNARLCFAAQNGKDFKLTIWISSSAPVIHSAGKLEMGRRIK